MWFVHHFYRGHFYTDIQNMELNIEISFLCMREDDIKDNIVFFVYFWSISNAYLREKARVKSTVHILKVPKNW